MTNEALWRVEQCGVPVLHRSVLYPRALSPLQVSIAVGLAGFACVLLVVLFVLINKYGRRSKFGMKGKVDFSKFPWVWAGFHFFTALNTVSEPWLCVCSFCPCGTLIAAVSLVNYIRLPCGILGWLLSAKWMRSALAGCVLCLAWPCAIFIDFIFFTAVPSGPATLLLIFSYPLPFCVKTPRVV